MEHFHLQVTGYGTQKLYDLEDELEKSENVANRDAKLAIVRREIEARKTKRS